jgi:hypothetical protein
MGHSRRQTPAGTVAGQQHFAAIDSESCEHTIARVEHVLHDTLTIVYGRREYVCRCAAVTAKLVCARAYHLAHADQ